VTLVVAGAACGAPAASDAQLEAALRGLLGRGVPGSQAARQLAAELGVPRRRAYDLALALKGEEPERGGEPAASAASADGRDPAAEAGGAGGPAAPSSA